MDHVHFDGSMNRETAAKAIASAIIAEFGSDAVHVARLQSEASAGDVQVSWKMILDAILEQGPRG